MDRPSSRQSAIGNRQSGRRGALVALVAAASLGLSTAGCGLLGAAAYKFSPPPKHPAQFVPAAEPTVVLVQRSQNPADAALDADRIARNVTADLRAHNVGPMLDPTPLTGLTAPGTGGSVWAAAKRTTTRPSMPAANTPAEMGRAVGARQVIYVDLEQFAVETAMASEMLRGQAAARVRVIDAETGETRWPKGSGTGYPLSLTTPYLRATADGGGNEAAVRDRMARELAARVGKLFYEWQADGVDTGTPVE